MSFSFEWPQAVGSLHMLIFGADGEECVYPFAVCVFSPELIL